jgi:hypothetical protein
MDDLKLAVYKAILKEISGPDGATLDQLDIAGRATDQALAAILRVAGSKPSPLEEAYKAGYWRARVGMGPDLIPRAFEEWNRNRVLTDGQARVTLES